MPEFSDELEFVKPDSKGFLNPLTRGTLELIMRADAANRPGRPGKDIQGFRAVTVELLEMTSEFRSSPLVLTQKKERFFELLDKLISLLAQKIDRSTKEEAVGAEALLRLFREGRETLLFMHDRLSPLLLALDEHWRILKHVEMLSGSKHKDSPHAEHLQRLTQVRNRSYMETGDIPLDEYFAACDDLLSSPYFRSLRERLTPKNRSSWDHSFEAATVKLEALGVLQ